MPSKPRNKKLSLAPSSRPVPPVAGPPAAKPRTGLPTDYVAVLEDIRSRIRTAQVRAALSVNRELIRLYWEIGGLIVRRQRAEGWGKAVIERLAQDLRGAFPEMTCFTARNIWHARAFFLAYRDVPEFLKQPVSELERVQSKPAADQGATSGPPPQPFLGIPWGHNILLLQRLKNLDQRLWYAQQTIANGWSRSMLRHWIESDLYSRQGAAITNFEATLPAPQSDLARQIVRDPYSFDFLTLRTDAAERDLERGLLANIRRFLLELGTGFAFVGQQVRLEVDGEDYCLDLLFYQLRRRCFVVVDLKTRRFRPEHAGQMNFYLSVVDDRLRHPDDRPSIGLILCRTRSRVIAEYALRDLGKPVGVSRYVTRLVPELPEELRGALPSPGQLTQGLRRGGPA